MFDSSTELLGWTAELAHSSYPCCLPTNHEEPAQGGVIIVNCLGAGNYASMFHHCLQSVKYSRTVPYASPMRISVYFPHQTVPLFYPYGAILHCRTWQSSRDFTLRVLRHLVFQRRRSPIEHGCASPHSTPNLRMGAPCAVSWSPVVMSCSRAHTDPPQRSHN